LFEDLLYVIGLSGPFQLKSYILCNLPNYVLQTQPQTINEFILELSCWLKTKQLEL